jgi:hypothetical protein
MKKVITIISGLAMMAGIVNHSNAQVFQKGTKVLNLGVGFLGAYRYGWGLGHSYSSTPFLNASFDFGIYDFPDVENLSIGLGAYLGWKNYSYSYYSTWRDKKGNWHYDDYIKETWTYTTFGIRPTIHYSFEGTKAQVYGGLPLGFVVVNHKVNRPDYVYYVNENVSSYPTLGLILGGRYYFSNSFGVYGELGYGLSYLNLGISLKF